MKILSIVGARPQFVKAAVLSRIFLQKGMNEILVHTGQHFDHGMSEVFFEEMEIPTPAYNLGINGSTHGEMTGKMLAAIEQVILKEQPDAVLVYGDTNSTLAGALAAKKLHIPVVHVEAGLRSFNNQMPEEINRVVTDRISDVLYVPTQTAIQNLKNEGFNHLDATIVLSGDVMQDAATFYAQKAASEQGVLANLKTNEFVLCTLHRAENTDNPERLAALVKGLNKLHKQISVVIPLHPRTRDKLKAANLKLETTTIDPVGYFDMIRLINASSLVITDSGGLQKEAYFFKKNCVTMRDQTEWLELVEHGFNKLVGADADQLVNAAIEMLRKQNDFSISLYGDGTAGVEIAEHLHQYLMNK